MLVQVLYVTQVL